MVNVAAHWFFCQDLGTTVTPIRYLPYLKTSKTPKCYSSSVDSSAAQRHLAWVKNLKLIRQFGLEVRRRRVELGVTQEQFAELSGLHRTYISGIEQGDRNPTLDIVFTIARALRCEPSTLMPQDWNETL
ncbi:helix-turn-helix transcriptional regulator [Rhodopseudomonas sp. G2_2311]|uniref:helix-turn-helix domain-containing protein n=1 Tax=Rhodopseudomonas sp. G2_2311 TaxID=3114287 RepID=UPI0039C6872F